jgi:hypothetical protein
MSHVGHTPSVTMVSTNDMGQTTHAGFLEKDKRRTQPTQSQDPTKAKKIVKSKPMDLTQLQGTNNPVTQIAAGSSNLMA